MSEFKEITAQFNVYDFLNPIISGSYLIFGCCIINFSFVLQCLSFMGFSKINTNNNFHLVFAILFYLVSSYILGLIIQFCGQYFFIKRERKMAEESLKELNTAKLFFKSPFNGSFKLEIFVKDAQDIFDKKNLGPFDPNNREHNSYFYSFCVYHNQIYGFNQKMEKLREVWGLSQELTTASFILALLSLIAASILGIRYNIGPNSTSPLEIIKDIILMVIFLGLTFIFFCRAQLALRNRIRMDYSVFHVSKGLYSMSLKIDNLHKIKKK